MSSNPRLSAEERKQRALSRIQAGGIERETRIEALHVAAAPVPPSTPATTQEPAPTHIQASTPAPKPTPAPPPPRPRTPPAAEEEQEIEPPSDIPESFGIQESRKGLRARGWKPKNTLFHPREIVQGIAFAEEMGLEWSELCNLALALVMDRSKRTDATDALLTKIRARREEQNRTAD